MSSRDELASEARGTGGLSSIQKSIQIGFENVLNQTSLADLGSTPQERIKNMFRFEIMEKDEDNMPAFRSVSLYRAVSAEFWASAVFVFVACGAAVSSGILISDTGASSYNRIVGGDARLLIIALAFGMSITVLVFAIGHLSGGHINSAVTIAFMLTKKISITRGGCYILAQLTGSTLGAAILKGVLPPGMGNSLGATTVAPDMNKGSAFFLEMILTSILLFTVFAAIDSSRQGEMHHALAPLCIGLAVFIDHLIGVPFTGCSINPSRSFGPAIVTGIWKDHWVYWLGPIAGACTSAVLYSIWFKKPEPKQPAAQRIPPHSEASGSNTNDTKFSGYQYPRANRSQFEDTDI